MALLRSTSLLGPSLFDQSLVRKANKDLKAAVALSQGVDSTKAMVSLASTAQQFMQKQGTAPAAKWCSRKHNQGHGSSDPKRQKFAQQPQQQQTSYTTTKQGQSTSRRRVGGAGLAKRIPDSSAKSPVRAHKCWRQATTLLGKVGMPWSRLFHSESSQVGLQNTLQGHSPPRLGSQS